MACDVHIAKDDRVSAGVVLCRGSSSSEKISCCTALTLFVCLFVCFILQLVLTLRLMWVLSWQRKFLLSRQPDWLVSMCTAVIVIMPPQQRKYGLSQRKQDSVQAAFLSGMPHMYAVLPSIILSSYHYYSCTANRLAIFQEQYHRSFLPKESSGDWSDLQSNFYCDHNSLSLSLRNMKVFIDTCYLPG